MGRQRNRLDPRAVSHSRRSNQQIRAICRNHKKRRSSARNRVAAKPRASVYLECGYDGSYALRPERMQDRKSTRLNSSHDDISYAVLCLKKKIIRREDGGCAAAASRRRRALQMVV